MSDFAMIPPPQLRLAQAEYFLERFRHASRPNRDSWFHMTAYFDAFLFAFVSIEEMDKPNKPALGAIGSFRFFKALRNVSAHHCVLAGAHPGSKFPRLLPRMIPASAGTIETDPVEFKLNPTRLEATFDAILIDVPSEKNNIAAARAYLSHLVASGAPIYMSQVMKTAVDEAKAIIG